VALAACALAGIACRRSAEAPQGSAASASRAEARVDAAPRAAGTRPDAAAAADAEAAASDEDDATTAARLNGLICKRPRCCVTRVMPAGVGADGTRYTVVRVDLLARRRRCAPPQTGEQEDVVDPEAIEANEDGETDNKQRERYRWDLVAERAGKVSWRQPLEIDYWSAGDFGMGGGEDSMSADAAARTITYSREGGSAWRGHETVTVGLDPLRVVQTSTRSWYSMRDNQDDVDWNWDTFAGKAWSATAFCRTNESADADVGDSVTAEVIIPMVTLPAAFVKAGWSTTALGGCAAFVDGGKRGHTIHGDNHAAAGDAEMRVVMSSGGVLFVEVIDNHLVPTASSWVKADHLELWRVLADESSGRSSGCFQPDPNAKALQWGIGVDGQVHKAHGPPASNPTVRVTRTEHVARFRIVLPDEGKGLTVVYSDSDDGARQKRLIATSQLEFGRTWTIGSVTPIGPGRATCVVDGATLRPKVAPLRRDPGLLFRNLPPDFDGNP